jgi:hypothetical protein
MATAKGKSFAAIAACLLLVGGGVVGVTSIIWSAKPRQVTVGATATRPTATLPALVVNAPAPPPAVATFSNGTTYELIGITDSPGRADRWWSAEGVPVAAPTPLPEPTNAPNDVQPGGGVYQIVIRKTDPPGARTGDMSFSVYLDGPKVESVWLGDMQMWLAKPGESQRLNFIFPTADRPAQGNVSVQLAYSAYTQDIRVALPLAAATAATAATADAAATRTANRAAATQPVIVVERVADDRRGKAEVTVGLRPDHEHERAYQVIETQAFLIDAAGKQHLNSGVRYPKDAVDEVQILTGFDISAKQAVAFQYRYRPWERLEFRDVSLRPGNRTTVTVAARPAPPPATAPAPAR